MNSRLITILFGTLSLVLSFGSAAALGNPNWKLHNPQMGKAERIFGAGVAVFGYKITRDDSTIAPRYIFKYYTNSCKVGFSDQYVSVRISGFPVNMTQECTVDTSNNYAIDYRPMTHEDSLNVHKAFLAGGMVQIIPEGERKPWTVIGSNNYANVMNAITPYD